MVMVCIRLKDQQIMNLLIYLPINRKIQYREFLMIVVPFLYWYNKKIYIRYRRDHFFTGTSHIGAL